MEESTDRAEDGRTDQADTEPGTAFTPALFERFGEAVPVGLAVVGDDGRFHYANETFRERLGCAEGELSGKTVEAVCSGTDLAAVRAQAEQGGDGPLTATVEHDEGGVAHLELAVRGQRINGRAAYVLSVHDVTTHRERERRLDQYERILETIEDGVYVLDDGFRIRAVNSAVEEMTGYTADELVGESAAVLADESTLEEAATVAASLRSGERDAATLSTKIRTKEGDMVPVETRFSVYQFEDGSYGQVGVVRDISERIQYERTLTALHDTTRELLATESEDGVGELVIEAAAEVIDLAGAVVYLFDEAANELRPAAATEGCGAVDGVGPVSPGDGLVWDVFARNESRVSTDPLPAFADGADDYERAICIPLDEFGVFVAAVDDASDTSTTKLVELLAASGQEALRRVDREGRLRERDQTLRAQNRRLSRLEQTNGIIRRIDQALVDADSREAVERAVCTQLVESPWFAFAWIGRPDGDRLEPSAWAGAAPEYLDAVDLSLDAEGPPGVTTALTDEVTVVSSVAESLREDPWRAEAISHDFQSVCSVPLTHEGMDYGVLTVYADRVSGFDDQLRAVLGELADTIASACQVVETRQWLSGDSVVELDLHVPAPATPLARLAESTGTRLDHDGVVPTAGGRSRAFFTLEGETLPDDAASVTGIESLGTLHADESETRYEAEVSTTTLAEAVVDRGGRVQSLAVDADGADLTVQLSDGTDVRRFVDARHSAYPSTTLVAKRTREPAVRSEGDLRATLRERLTDRQWEVLRTAFLSGFFEWPRATTGQEVADLLGVSQPTVNKHLRVGERKLLALLFEEV